MPDSTTTTLTAADVMTPNPLCCDVLSPVLEAVRIFREADCGAVPVIEEGKLFGVLTDRDVALAIPDLDDLANEPIGKITAPGVIAVGPNVVLSAVAAKFADRGVRRVLVIDDQGKLQGIIGWADLAHHLSNQRLGRTVARLVEKP